MDHIEDLLSKINALTAKNQDLQGRLNEAEEALQAISTGEVDALVVYGEAEERIYTLQGADYAYRVMVESIHEGAATINAQGTILYCNKRLAEMLEMPLEKVLGASFFNFLFPPEQPVFATLTSKSLQGYAKAEFNLVRQQGLPMPVLISAGFADINGQRGICLVVSDRTEQKQAMARERELQTRLMEQREDERVRIARNLHDGPLQDVIGLSYTIQAMRSPDLSEAVDGELATIRASILKLAGDLRGVCNELRPPNTIRFGLAKAIRYHSEEIQTKHPQLEIHLELAEDGQAIPKEVSTALFRIYQESINNILRHSSATSTHIRLLLGENTVGLEIQDDGKGFTPPDEWVELARHGHLGLVGMRERAESVGGKLNILSAPSHGTTIQVEVPCQLMKM